MSLKKKATLAVATAAAVLVVVAAGAFACTNLATLNLSSTAGKAGDTVTVTGTSFAVARDGGPSLPVVLHWNGVDGAVLAQAVPDSAGNISATFTVPDGLPGYYVLVATQRDAKGVDTYGTPARASYQILGPNGQSVVKPAIAPDAGAPVPAGSSSTGIVALTAALGLIGLGLFGAGFVSLIRPTRAAPTPARAGGTRS
ncbi:MAG TPA: hypothetical protein VL337_01970 [Acidimicrobiales bacterium]|jgi:hypothetical protein|nr:hypothetical protein [Acidimicrobiales bacterium]